MAQRQQDQKTLRKTVVSSNRSSLGMACHRTLRQLLLQEGQTIHEEAYGAPTFQRRYCWTTNQWDALWLDVFERGRLKRSTTRHCLGRLTCASAPQVAEQEVGGVRVRRSVIIDGQQKLTSVTLLLAAIRDALLSISGVAFNQDDDPLVESIHQMLFLDVSVMEQWLDDNNDSDSNPATNTIQQNTLHEGLALDFCRWIPTYCDRSAYLAAILPSSAQPVRRFMAESYTPSWHRPLLAKQHFAYRIQSLLADTRIKSPKKAMHKLTSELLDGTDFLCMSVDATQSYPNAFNDNAIDTIRSHFLASFATLSSKTDFYSTCWLPLERMLYQTTGGENDDGSGDDERLSELLKVFLNDQESKLEPKPKGHLSGPFTLADVGNTTAAEGGNIYRDFETWMALDLQLWQQHGQRSLSSGAEDHTRDVVRRLLDFARGETKQNEEIVDDLST